jgi:ribose transport system ATP-binding protein
MARMTPRKAWRAGFGYLSENRKEEGLMLSQSIADNITLAKLPAFGRWGWVDSHRQDAASQTWIDRLKMRCRGPRQRIGELSGGNQQKAALARLLEHPARVFLLDEPTRGIDVGSKAQIYAILGELAARGKAVLLVSSYLPELLGLCDTIGVVCRGELTAVRPRAEWTEESILRTAIGTA